MTVFAVSSKIRTYLAKIMRRKRYIAIETEDLLAVLIPHKKIAILPRIWTTQNDAPYSFFLHQRLAIISIIVIHLPRLALLERVDFIRYTEENPTIDLYASIHLAIQKKSYRISYPIALFFERKNDYSSPDQQYVQTLSLSRPIASKRPSKL